MDASHTTAFAYSSNASIRVGDYDDVAEHDLKICADHLHEVLNSIGM